VTINGTFNNNSDRNTKFDIAAVAPGEILEKLAELPISTWRYRSDAATPHIGPMAQDFFAAFGVGTDEKHIAPIDEGGVALAAIQGLNRKLEDRARTSESRMEKLETENENLKKEVAELRDTLATLAEKLGGTAQ